MKRITALLMALCFVCVAFVGCSGDGDGKDSSKHTVYQPETDPNGNVIVETDTWGREIIPHGVPLGTDAVDFTGKEITVAIRTDNYEMMREFYSEDPQENLEVVIDERNELILDDLGLEVKYYDLSGGYEALLDSLPKLLTDDVLQNYHKIDAASTFAMVMGNSTIRDYIANLMDKNTFPYFDFTKPWWNQAVVENTSINGMMFYCVGDMNLSAFDQTPVVWYNKDEYNTRKKEGDVDLQDLAIEGKWTLDELSKWASIVSELDNLPGYGADDFYGIRTPGYTVPFDALVYAYDLEFLTKNADGSLKFNVEDNARVRNSFNATIDLINQTGVRFEKENGESALEKFTQSKSLFLIEVLYKNAAGNELIRNMSADFGILPLPKYTEDQENYGTTPCDGYNLTAVLNHEHSTVKTKGAEVSAWLELSQCYSYRDVRPYYFEKVVQLKYFGQHDESAIKSSIIFNMIIDNLSFDFITVYSPQLGNFHHNIWRNRLRDQDVEPEQAFKDRKTKMEEYLATINQEFGLC